MQHDTSERLRDMRKDIYRTVARLYTNGDTLKAKNFIMRIHRHYRNKDVFLLGFSFGIVAVCLLMSIYFLASAGLNSTEKSFDPAFPIFRLTFSAVFLVWMGTGVVAMFEW
jgi:hypothetical protein